MAVGAPILVASLAEAGNTNSAHIAPVVVPVPVGTVVVATIVESVATHTHTCGDSKGNTWTPMTKASNAGTQPISSQYFWTVVTTALTTSDTITVTSSSTGNAVVIAEAMPAADTGSPIDVGVTSATGNSTAWAGNSISPAIDSMAYCAGGIGIGTATESGIAAGWTKSQRLGSAGTGSRALLSVYKPTLATGAVSAAATITSATNSWSAMTISIKAAATLEQLRGRRVQKQSALVRASSF